MKVMFFCLIFLTLALPVMSQQTQTAPMSKDMTAKCREMMKMHQEMQTKMKEMDQSLNELQQKMNQATGDQKIQAMEALLNEMLRQRTMMRETMMKHQPMMMHHMGQHMQKRAMSMMDCPVYKQMHKDQQ